MAADETARALEFLRDVRFCISSAGDVGVETERSAGCFNLRRRVMVKVGDKINSTYFYHEADG